MKTTVAERYSLWKSSPDETGCLHIEGSGISSPMEYPRCVVLTAQEHR